MIKRHLKTPEIGLKLVKHACCPLSQNKAKRETKGRGVSLPYARPQTIFFTTENPLDISGEKSNTTKVNKA